MLPLYNKLATIIHLIFYCTYPGLLIAIN